MQLKKKLRHAARRRTAACYSYAVDVLEHRTLLSGYAFSSVSLPPTPSGVTPVSSVIADSAGNLFGTTSEGGSGAAGTVFEIRAAAPNTITTLASFNDTNGRDPEDGVVLDAAGDLFGTTYAGGSANDGTVFEIKASAPNTIVSLASFTGLNGQNPRSGVTLDSAGNLFGTTYNGGSGSLGTVFEIAASTPNTINTLASFSDTNGANPFGRLAIDSAGNLFGTTVYGGTGEYGTVFEIKSTTPTTITTLANFSSSLFHPNGGVVIDSSGNLFGTASTTADGAVYEIMTTAPGTITKVANFTNATGYEPIMALVLDSAGDLFGTTTIGGVNFYGTVFEIKASTPTTITTLLSFNSINGNFANGLSIDSAGNLFATTQSGGANNLGTVFKISATQLGTVTTLASFGRANGMNPVGGVVADAAGNLFGVTSKGSPYGDGTVFEIKASNPSAVITLASFNGSNGDFLYAGLVFDAAGNLFGTTFYGGDNGYGTVFELPVSSQNTIVTLASFDYTNSGAYPSGMLTTDSAGDLFGVTYGGGAYGDGTAYEIAATTPNTITVLTSFSAATGTLPYGRLSRDSSGNFYGTTSTGPGSGYGTVFQLSGSSHTITTLVTFTTATGRSPHSGVVVDASGNIFGTTTSGGVGSFGTVYELKSTSRTTITTLVNFDDANTGRTPLAGLSVDPAGNLFGTTSKGGSGGYGTVFEIKASTPNTATTLVNFSGPNGQNPSGDLTLDSAGDVIGTTPGGSASGDGTIFKLTSLGTATNVSVANATATYGQTSVTISANVSSTASPGVGFVTFSLVTPGSTAASSTFTAAVSGGVASTSLNASNLSSGYYTVLAGYSDPNGPFAGSFAAPATLTIGTVLALSGNAFYLTLDTASPPNLDVYSNSTGTGVPAQALPIASVAAINVTGSAGGDQFIADFQNGSVVPLSGLSFVGNTAGANTLTIVGVGGPDAVSAAVGSFTINGATVNYSQIGTVNYTSGVYLETVSVNAGTVMLAPGTTTGINSTIFTNVLIAAGAALTVTYAPTANRMLIGTKALTLAGQIGAWTSTLDLKNGDLDISIGDFPTLYDQIRQSFNNGVGGGVISSTAASNSTHLTALGLIRNNQGGQALFSKGNRFDGRAPAVGDFLIKYTYFGDANLDGRVDGSDYSLIDSGYLSHGASTGWFNGDFNYDGLVNGSDYTLIDNAFNTQGAQISALVSSAIERSNLKYDGPARSCVQMPTHTFATESIDWSAIERKKSKHSVI